MIYEYQVNGESEAEWIDAASDYIYFKGLNIVLMRCLARIEVAVIYCSTPSFFTIFITDICLFLIQLRQSYIPNP